MRKIGFYSAPLLLLLGLVVLLVWPRQPFYRGRSLEFWIGGQFVPAAAGEAAEAIHQMGTNAIPYLLRWIRYETPAWKLRLWKTLNPFLSKHKIDWQPADLNALARADGAARALIRLGPAAEGAIPELTRLIEDPRANESAIRAMFVLGCLGDAGLPPLIGVLKNQQARFRAEAAESIGFTGTKRAAPIVALLACTSGRRKDETVAPKACIALETLKLDPALVLLINHQDNRADARTMTSTLLTGFWKARFAEVRTLAALLTNTDPELRQIATNAQRRIDRCVLEQAHH